MIKFDIWQKEQAEQKMLAESKGIFPERITNGECIFTDRRGDVWTATSWRYISRYMTNSSDAKQKSPIDNPDYIRALKEVVLLIGTIDASEVEKKSKGIVVVGIKDSLNKTILVGRHTTKDEEPKKIENSDFSAAGYIRRTKKDSQLQTLSASHFLKGAPERAIRIGETNIQHYDFKNTNAIKTSILTNMVNSSYKILSEPAMIKATKEFLDGGAVKFDWSIVGSLMTTQDRAKFGIYLVSELCYPFHVWEGRSIQNFPGFTKTMFFSVPVSNSNAGYDSYLRGVMADGTIGNLMVSSKTISSSGAKGARSSLLPKLHALANALPDFNSISNKFLARFLTHFKTSKNGSGTVYPFMINTLKLQGKIKDPVDLYQRICKLHGKRVGKLTDAQIEQTKNEVVDIQLKVNAGITLDEVGIKVPLNQNAAKYPTANQWKDFSKYISDIFCDAIAVGMNSDGASDLRPSISWQISLDNKIFIETGNVHFIVSQASNTPNKLVVDNGKQSAGDPSRNITWIGVRPL